MCFYVLCKFILSEIDSVNFFLFLPFVNWTDETLMFG